MVDPRKASQTRSTARDFGEVLLEVAAHRVHLDAGILRDDRRARALQHAGVDVERDEPAQRAAAMQRVEQHPGLLRRATAEFDEGVGARHVGD